MKLQEMHESSEKTDLRFMKVIHDLKNPIVACRQIVNDKELSLVCIKDMANKELEDLEDMFENLRAAFKSRHNIGTIEKPRFINS